MFSADRSYIFALFKLLENTGNLVWGEFALFHIYSLKLKIIFLNRTSFGGAYTLTALLRFTWLNAGRARKKLKIKENNFFDMVGSFYLEDLFDLVESKFFNFSKKLFYGE